MAHDLNFKQMLLIAAVPSVVSAASAFYASEANISATKIESRQAITQSRVTERDLILHEAGEIGAPAYSIPVADNRAWSNYYNCRTLGGSRFDCSKDQKRVIPEVTPKIISEPLDDGY